VVIEIQIGLRSSLVGVLPGETFYFMNGFHRRIWQFVTKFAKVLSANSLYVASEKEGTGWA